MPVTYSVDPARHRIITVGTGIVTAEEFLRLRAAFREDPAVVLDMDHVVDLRKVDVFAVPGPEVHRMAQDNPTLEPWAPGTRVAIVTSSSVGFGLARMYELSRSAAPEDIEVFGDMEAATMWLDEGPGTRRRAAAD